MDTLRIHLDVLAALNRIDDTLEFLRGHLIVYENTGIPIRHVAAFIQEVSAIRQSSEDQIMVEDDEITKVREFILHR